MGRLSPREGLIVLFPANIPKKNLQIKNIEFQIFFAPLIFARRSFNLMFAGEVGSCVYQ